MEILVLVPFAILYFMPGIAASSRKNPAAAGVWVLNIFLGWTLLGWVVALAWALSNKRAARTVSSEGILLSGTNLTNTDGAERAEIIAHLGKGSRLAFIADSDNPHDRDAIAVTAPSGVIGYIPRDQDALRRAIRCGDYKHAKVIMTGHANGAPVVSIEPIRRPAESVFEGLIWFLVDGGASKLAGLGAAGAVVALFIYATSYQSAPSANRLDRSADQDAEATGTVAGLSRPRANWIEHSSLSAIDDSPIVALTTRALGQPRGSYDRELEIRLVLRCANNTTNLFLQVDDYTGIDAVPVTFRVDSNSAFNRNLTPSSGREALGLWAGRDAIPVIRELLDSQRLTVRYVLPGEDPQTVRFNTSDLDTRIRALRTACNW